MQHSPSERSPLLAANSVEPSSNTIPGASVATDGSGDDPLHLSRAKKWSILSGVWLAMFLAAINTTVVATLLSTISSQFDASNQSGWLGTAYLLATCTFTPLYGRLSDIMGRRRANQLAVSLMGAGVLASGFANSMWALILARFISGMGGGGINTTASVITSDMFSARDRGLAQGFTSVFNALGLGLGGPLGGYLSDRFGWRWAFLSQLPIFVLSFLLTEFNLHYVTPAKSRSTREMLRRVDWFGTLTLFIFTTSLLTFLSAKFNSSPQLPFLSPIPITSLCLTILATFAFIYVQLYVAVEPTLPREMFKHKEAIVIGMSNFLVPICNYAVMYFLPTWFQTVKLDSAGLAGAHIMPHSVAMSTGSVFAGYVMRRTNQYKPLLTIAGILPFVAGMLFSTMTERSPWPILWFAIIPYGFGNACVLQATLSALLASIPRKTLAVGTGFIQFYRGIGQVLGVAIGSAVFQSVLDVELHKRIKGPGAEETILEIRRSTDLVHSLPPDLQRSARDSYAVALRWVFIVATACTLLAYCVRLFLQGKPLDPVAEDSKPKASPPATPGSGENENERGATA